MKQACTIKPLSSSNWNDFVSLMDSDAQCSECWCLNHREAACATGLSAKHRMQALVSSEEAQGLLAFQDRQCIGWVSVDPMRTLHGHDCQSTCKEGEWSIHCIFIKEGFRGTGISTLLIQAAVSYARERGARLISAFPIPNEHRFRYPAGEAEFSGRYSTYAKLGFVPIAGTDQFYQRMELR